MVGKRVARLSILPLLFSWLPSSAQADSTSLFDWNILAEHQYHRHLGGSEVYQTNPTNPRRRFTWTDYPLIHGATYGKFVVHAEPIRGFWLNGELVAEHRGFSYGVYPANEIIAYPRILLGINTAFLIPDAPLSLKLRLGHFSNLKLQEGLTIFNMDVQGVDFVAGYRSLFLRVNHIGDLEYSYGLNLNDWHTTSFELRDVMLGGPVKLITSFTLEGVSVKPTQWSAAARVSVQDWAAYGSVGRRPDLQHFKNNWATLLGVEMSGTRDSSYSVTGSLEYRFYASGYNSRRFSREIRYRGGPISGYPTIGKFLYPLDRFDRPYVAWALYTQYQSSDVESASAYCKGRLRLWHDIWLHGMGEIVGLRTAYYGSPVLPFYEVSLNWEPREGCFGRVGIGNRTMNLDEHFPTLYATKVPAIVIGVGVKY